jgi:serine/threonine protein kinase
MVALMKYAEGGTLRDLIADEVRFTALLVPDKLRMLSQIAWAMATLYRHDPPIVHRDLKSSNVLLDKHGTCLLSDFGLAKQLTEFTDTFTHAGTGIGTPAWSSPEYLEANHQGEKSDVWSWAVIAVELFTGDLPWPGLTLLQIISALQSGKQPPMPSITGSNGCPKALAKLVKQCWSTTVRSRPTFLDILSKLEVMGGTAGVGVGIAQELDTADVRRRRNAEDSERQSTEYTSGRSAFPTFDPVTGRPIGADDRSSNLNADATSHDDRLLSSYEGKHLTGAGGGERISVRGSANEGIGDEVLRTPLLLLQSQEPRQ